MADSLFGTDGVRGAVGTEPITPQTVLKLGWAAGSVFAKAGAGDKVLIGKDTRISGYLLESALEAGFSAAGVNVCFLGPLPTPGIAYLTRTARACAGIAISASHNPYYDNGIKIFSAGGIKLDDAILASIDRKMRLPMGCVDSSQLGRAERLTDAQGRYIEFCKGTLPTTRSLSGLKIVVDCANGAAYDVAPHVFSEMGAEVIAIGNQPDGFNINHQCGSTHLDMLIAKVIQSGADIGIAFDGDADRVLLVDAAGRAVDGDKILYLLANRRCPTNSNRDLGEFGVVGTQMSNLGLERALSALGINFGRAKVGDRYIHEMLIGKKWALGGEPSGHIICLDKTTTGDGIIAALEVLDTMIERDSPLDKLVAGLENYPQVTVNVALNGAACDHITSDKKVRAAVAQAESELANNGRVVLRPSGTEPLIRVMLEGEHFSHIEQLATQIAAAIESAIGSA